jgi:DNA adenine methylase
MSRTVSAVLPSAEVGLTPLERALLFPQTRYMGSKFKLLPFLYETLNGLQFRSAIDAFSGSGSVSYLLKCMGKRVLSNDHLRFCYHIADATVANSVERLDDVQVEELSLHNRHARRFVETTFRGIYFNSSDNRFLDSLVANIGHLQSPQLQSLALAAACRACVKRRPRGVFTYVGDRYNDGRKDLQLPLKEHFRLAVAALNSAVFDNGRPNRAANTDIFALADGADLIYLDPPYVSPSSDNDYTRRYHFLEGLVRYWQGIAIQHETATKKFRPLPTPFRSRTEVRDGFDRLFRQAADSIIVLSYSSTAIPGRSELVRMLRKYKKNVDVVTQQHSYSFGTHRHKKNNEANRVQELLFIGTD